MFLAAICPPNNAFTHFLKLKQELFRQSASLSAWALRPMVPFCLTGDEVPEPEKSRLPRLPERGISAAELLVEGDQLYLGSEELSEYCGRLTSALFPQAEPSGCGFPVCRGLHLADLSEKPGMLDVARSLFTGLPESSVVWRSASLVFIKTELSGSRWWERIVLEELWERPLLIT